MQFVIDVSETYVKRLIIDADGEDDAVDIAAGMDVVMQPENYLSESTEYTIVTEE